MELKTAEGEHPAFGTPCAQQSPPACGAQKWCCRSCPEGANRGGGGGCRRPEGRTTAWSDSFVECLACPEFIARAEADPRGWSGFVAEQAQEAMEEALARATENMEIFFQIMASLPDGLLTVNKEGAVNYFNPTAQRMTGLSVEEVIGRNCEEILPDSVCAQYSRVKDIDPRSDALGTAEYSVHRVGGAPTPVISSASLIRDELGEAVGVVEVFKDISIRRSLEKELQRSERKYRRIFENTKDMIFVIDKQGLFKDVNQACVEILEYGSREDLLASGPINNHYVHPLHAKVFRKQIDRWGYIRDFETLLKTKEGTELHCLVTGNAIYDDDQQVVGYEGIAKDITARVHALRTLQRRHRDLSFLNSVALAINAAGELRPALDTVLAKVLELLGAHGGGVFLVDRAKHAFPLAARRGLFREDWEDSCRFVLDDAPLMASLLAEDLELAPESAFPPFHGTLYAGPGAQPLPMTCFLIPGKQRPLGFIGLELGEDAPIKNQDLGLLGSLGNFMGGAIDNYVLQDEKRKHRRELKDLTARMFKTREVERERIARELHDEAGQSLTGINLAIDSISKHINEELPELNDPIAEVRTYINHTYREMRRISHRLHPAILNDLGIEAALDAYFQWIIRHSSLNVAYQVVGFEEDFDREIAIALYRLSQEAFTNTQKHARAQHFKLSIVKSYPRVIFVAEDDGEGFDVTEVDWAGRSLGLVSMRERAAVLGGSFILRSDKGQGTVIRIEIPLKEASDAVG
jgi:PAS domain S-box-containing protein